MFINRLINQGNIPLLEQSMKFSAARQEVLAENVANLSTPGYLQKDLDPDKFQRMLRERVAVRKTGAGGGPGMTSFEGLSKQEILQPTRGILFHDGNNRTVEQLMSEVGKNALKHNLYAEILRRQFSSMDSAIKGQVA